MAKTQKKPTNKAKFSLYLDKGVMAKVAKIAVQEERSINFITERILKENVGDVEAKPEIFLVKSNVFGRHED